MPKPAGRAFMQIEATDLKGIKRLWGLIRKNYAVEYDRDVLRQIGRILIKHLGKEAPVGKHYRFDGTEYDPPKRLKDSFFYRTYLRGKKIRLSIYSSMGDILRYVILGTRRHPITPKPTSSSQVLAFYWARQKKSVIVASVVHPGTLPNLFHRRAYNKARPEITLLQRRAARQTAMSLIEPPVPKLIG